MKLQDYLHYYYNGQCLEAIKVPGQELRFDTATVTTRTLFNVQAGLSEVKLVLRRLEDMTEEEANYIINNYSFCSVDMPMNEKKFAIEIAKRLINQMPVAHYLLQKHFDLFGLIDAGLAIDLKTLNP